MSRTSGSLVLAAAVAFLPASGCAVSAQDPEPADEATSVAQEGSVETSAPVETAGEGTAEAETAEAETAEAETAEEGTEVTKTEGEGAGPGLPAYGLAVLATPAEATHLTVTDFAAVRARLGVPDLTSEDLMSDRLEFWRSAEASTVLLTDGLLRAENSRYDLTYGFTQDDVDAEVHWTVDGADGGWLLRLRPDLDPALVRAAVDDGAPEIGEADWDPAQSVLSEGVATGAVWATDPVLAELGDVPAESLIVRAGCVPFTAALGVDATVEDQDEVLAAHDVAGLVDVEATAIAFTGMTATVRLGYPEGTPAEQIEADLEARLALGQDWPTTETIGFSDGFGAGTVAGVDGTVGELEYAVTRATAAANLALADLVPLGVCSDVDYLEEPTGL